MFLMNLGGGVTAGDGDRDRETGRGPYFLLPWWCGWRSPLEDVDADLDRDLVRFFFLDGLAGGGDRDLLRLSAPLLWLCRSLVGGEERSVGGDGFPPPRPSPSTHLSEEERLRWPGDAAAAGGWAAFEGVLLLEAGLKVPASLGVASRLTALFLRRASCCSRRISSTLASSASSFT